MHEFDFENHRVSVKVPRLELANRDKRFDDVASIASSRADTDEVLSYRVRKVDVEILVPELISVPKEALSNPPKQIEHFSKGEKEVADRVCNEHSALAARAFQYWLEMMRWASDSALIGQYSIDGYESGLSTYLIDSETKHRVWASPAVLTVYRESEVTREHWEVAAEHLRNGDKLPMHLRFYHSTRYMFGTAHNPAK